MPNLMSTGRLALVAALLAAGVTDDANAQNRPVEQQNRAAEPPRAVPGPKTVPGSSLDVKLSFAPIVKSVASSVVNVYGARVEKNPRRAVMDDFFRRFFGDAMPPGGVPDRTQRSLGSGVIVDPDGLVITNYHVIENMTEVKVALADRREIEAEIVLRDPRADLAVLRLKGRGPYRAIAIGDADALEVGDLVLAIGNPFGVGQTVTQGIVSGLARTNVAVSDFGYFIQTDAAINPGNSGGALVDMHGQLVGINSAIYSQSGGSVGIGFAIPATMVKAVVASAEAGAATMQRPWLGASLQKVTPDIADGLGLEAPVGALVASVRDDSPAAASGLRRGDVITEVDGRPVDDPESFGWRFALKGVNGSTPITINRDGRRQVLGVRLARPPENPPRDPLRPRGRIPFAGATFVNLSPAVADEMRTEASDGVIVEGVEDGSVAGRIGLQKGDVIVALNGLDIRSTRDLDRAMHGSAPWQVTINRGGQVLTSVLGG